MISETYPEDYLDVDFLIKTLFDYVYIDIDKCYAIQPLDYNKITISDIKLVLDKSRQKKLVNSIFNTKIEWLRTSAGTITFKRPMDIYSTGLYLKIIKKDEDQFNINASVNMNAYMTWLLSDLVITRKTKGILLNMMNVDIDFELLEDFYSNIPQISSDFLDVLNKKDKVINITVFEYFFKIETLSKIIMDLTWNQLKSIIFQVAHTLAVIQEKYNGFRHNFLFTYTLSIYIKKPKINTYRLGSKEIKMNDEGYEVKITAFSKSYIPKIAENNGIMDANKELNNIIDLIKFLEDAKINVKDEIKKNISILINNIEKNDKNILLSEIIMNKDFLNI